LTSIVIPESVTSIGNGAFSSCRNLKDIVISESLINIGSYVFEDCHSLTSIVIPESVKSIGDSAFSNCDNIIIYSDVDSKPNGWHSCWNNSNRLVYWSGQWEYDSNGKPTPLTNVNDEMNGIYGLSHIIVESITHGTKTTYQVGEYYFGMLLSTNMITTKLNNGTGTLSYTFERTVTTNITYEVEDGKVILNCEDAVDLYNDGNLQNRYELLIEEIEGEIYFVLKASNGVYNFSYYVVKQNNN
jgi:hypothetical protein